MQITPACQCDCIHCSAARHRQSERALLTTDECKTLIRQSQELGVVNIILTGGEPLLRKDVYELLSFINKDEAIAMIFTNGLLLTDENVSRLCDAGLFSLNVSLDAPEAEAHDAMRRAPGCFDRALEGIQRCLAAGLLCGISTYATPERVRTGKVMEMVELGRKLGVHEVTIFDVVPTGRLIREDESSLLTEQDKQYLCELEEDINGRTGWPHVITQAHVNGPTGAGCYAGWFQFYSTSYGDVMPCDFTPLGFGNVREEPLRVIWERLISHASYCERSDHCRMQDKAFRHQWIDRIPAHGPFPYPIAALEAASGEPADEEPAQSALGIRA
jgi:MoaA/NifB/PqqE/SkfB family radical SAM enzyme